MNKTEKKAYEWLRKQGDKGIIYQKTKTPDFLTDSGGYEVKRAYRLKTGQAKILIRKVQMEKIRNSGSKILVFCEDKSDPIEIIENEELGSEIIRGVIIHEPNPKKNSIAITLEKKLIDKMDQMIKDGVTPFSSRSRLIEYHLMNAFFPSLRVDISVDKRV